MGNRLSKIYTRTGDGGETGLAGGERVAKDCPRIEAIGAVDELNCAVGVLLAEALPDEVKALLLDVQHRLFDLGGELSMPDTALLDGATVPLLEEALDRFNAELPPLREFILPGGGRAGALCHAARACARRAERRLISLGREATLQPAAISYLNRLSDLLFVLARTIARAQGHEETFWRSART